MQHGIQHGHELSTHDLTQRSTRHRRHVAQIVIVFQLTTSRRGRLMREMKGQQRAVFQLTTSRRGRRFSDVGYLLYGYFQLTTSRRGRRMQEIHRCGSTRSFNSRPHAEVDQFWAMNSRTRALSTHDLTQRSTCSACFAISKIFLSTHDLTQRSTTGPKGDPGDVTFQLTTSRRGRRRRRMNKLWLESFNSRPHAEVD